MHVMLLAQCYAPEEVSAAVLISELAAGLAQWGQQVTVVTTAPNYPYGRVYPGYRNRVYASERRDGVRVVRTWSYLSPRKTFWRRILNHGTYSATAFYGALLAGRPDVLVSFSPPLPLGLSAWLLSRIWRIPWLLQIEDLYPEAAVAAGYLRGRAAIRFFSALARFLYRQATHISLIAESFRQNLLEQGVPARKISLIPVWADPDVVRPLPKENAFRQAHGLAGKFVVLYAGNLGLTSCLEDVLEAAMLLKDEREVCFVIVGEGVKKPALEQMAQDAELDNVRILPYQPRQALPELLAAADLSLVTLNLRAALASLPSKVFNIMASARPVLAVAPPESEIARLVVETGCGVSVLPGRPEALAEAILALRKQTELLDEMGRRGRAVLEARFAREGCLELYAQMLYKCRTEKSSNQEMG